MSTTSITVALPTTLAVCLNWDAFGAGNLTLTNVTVAELHGVLWGPGGGIWAENSAGGGTGTLTISGGHYRRIIPRRKLGGGIQTSLSPRLCLSITDTTFTGNAGRTSSVNPVRRRWRWIGWRTVPGPAVMLRRPRREAR